MIIDSHQHFWHYHPEKDAWIDDSMKILQRDFLPDELEKILIENNVAGCVAVQADQSEKETAFLLDCAKKHRFIKGVVGWVDLMAKNITERLAYFNENILFKGVRHIVQAEDDGFLLQENFQNGIRQLSQLGLTYDILVYPRRLKNTIKFVEKFPNQIFILDHLAKPYINDKMDAQWKKGIKILSTFENVHCKISGLVTESKHKEIDQNHFTPYLDIAVENFGVDRLLFGSDWPVCLVRSNYQKVLKIIQNYFADFSKDQQEKVFYKNAIDIYRLKF